MFQDVFIVRRRVCSILILVAVLAAIPASAQSFLFQQSGTNFSSLWQASLPNAHGGSFPSGSSLVATYAGAANYYPMSITNTPALLLTNRMGPLVRRGWMLNTNFSTDNFRYEIRFNSLLQSSSSSVDGFVEIWVLDPTNPNNYDIISPFGGNYGSDFYVFTGSSIDGNYAHTSYTHHNFTWYRLVLEAQSGQNIHASLCDDNENEIFGADFAHGLGSYPNGFSIALSQSIGSSGTAYPDEVAVGHVVVTPAATPPGFVTQPQSRQVNSGAKVTLNAIAAGDGPVQLQWYFNNAVLPGQTNSSLTLTNIHSANSGTYCLQATNAYGATMSAAAQISFNPGPPISMQTDGNLMLLYWSTSAPAILQTTTNLATANWVPATPAPVTIGSQVIYPTTMTGPSQFYRLDYVTP